MVNPWKKLALISLLISLMMTSGCISEAIDEKLKSEDDYVWDDDGELVIVTYDVTGLTDSMLSDLRIKLVMRLAL